MFGKSLDSKDSSGPLLAGQPATSKATKTGFQRKGSRRGIQEKLVLSFFSNPFWERRQFQLTVWIFLERLKKPPKKERVSEGGGGILRALGV